MKILAHTISPSGFARVQVQHGIWPFRWYREYVGHDDQWQHRVVDGPTFRFPAPPRVRAALTRLYADLTGQS